MKKLISTVLMAFAVLAVSFQVTRAVQQLDNYLNGGGVNVQVNGKTIWKIGGEVAVDQSMRVQNSTGPATGVASNTVVISTNGGVEINADEGSASDGPLGPGLYMGVGNGGYAPIGMSSATTAQLGAQIPRRVGEFVYNASIKMPCYSTNTVKGAYALFGATSAVSAPTTSVPAPCN